MHIAITGAGGHLAYFLVRYLAEMHTIDAWVRPGASQSPARFMRSTHPQVVYREVDLADPSEVRSALEGVDAVVHLAYAHIPGRYRSGHGDDLDGWFRRNLAAHLNLVLGANAQGVQNFIYLSSRAVYSGGGLFLAERDTLQPDSHYGALKAACEMLLAGFEGMRHTAIRCTGVYGCVEPIQASKWFDLLCQMRTTGVLTNDQIGTEVHGDDLARVVGLLLEVTGPWPASLNVSDRPFSHAMLADALSYRTGLAIRMPERHTSPRGLMTCEWLAQQRFVFSGVKRWMQTVNRLIDASVRKTSR